MRPTARTFLVAALASALAACASVPRDSGFADVRRTVVEETRQAIEWDPRQPVPAADDAALAAGLQEPLTVERAVQLAFAHNRDVQATLEGLGIARAELIKASTIRNPIFDGEIRFPDEPRNPVEIHVTKTLVDLFQLRNRKRLGRARFEAARLQVSGAIIHFAGQVRMDWYDLLASRKILARQETSLKAQEAAAELTARQHSAGNISDLDLETEQSRYEQAKLDLARAQLDELQARERLIADLGSTSRVELRLPDDFPPPPESELTAAQAESHVVERRLDIRMAGGEIEAAERALPLARTEFLDDLAAGVHLEREPDGKKTVGPDLSVPIPIFDRGAAQRTGARAMLRQAQQRFAAMVASARSEARAAQERLAEARSRMAYLRDVVVPRRDRILKLTQLEYNAMLRGVYQLIEARQGLASAQREEVMATRDYWVARTELETALLGVSRFSVRPEAGESRLDRSRPMTQPESKTNEHD